MISLTEFEGGEIVYAVPTGNGITYCYEESSVLGVMKQNGGKFKDPILPANTTLKTKCRCTKRRFENQNVPIDIFDKNCQHFSKKKKYHLRKLVFFSGGNEKKDRRRALRA